MLEPTPKRPSRSTIPSALPASNDEVKKIAERLEDDPYTAGPIYQNINKRLACIYFEEQQFESAIFHLAESHGCSLRHQAKYRYDQMQENTRSTCEERQLGRDLQEIVALDGQYTLDKYQGLLNRLAELPSEWTIVQFTVQYDPMTRLTQLPPKEQNSIHLTRMWCGKLKSKPSTQRQSGPPVSVVLSPISGHSDALDIVATLNEVVGTYKKVDKTKIYNTQQINKRLESLIRDFEYLLKDLSCLLPGNLVNLELHKTICSQVDEIVKKLAGSETITETQRQMLYLLATTTSTLFAKESETLKTAFTDGLLAKSLYKAIQQLHEKYREVLSSATRHPVIIILDEALDDFPVEMLGVLKNQAVTRIPSVHFAQALYREHLTTTFRSGIKSDDGFYIVNPSGDLKDCEKKFRDILPGIAPNWKGIFGEAPTEAQFLDALAKKAIFLYCGHGGGNQYANTTGVQRIRTKAVTFLIGCRSVKVTPQGGRVDGISVFDSYVIGGCPCTIGTIWDVTDTDANRMTEYLLKRWLKPLKPSKSETVEDMINNLSIQDDESAQPDIARLLAAARTKAKHLRNSAALVIKGLPVRINWT